MTESSEDRSDFRFRGDLIRGYIGSRSMFSLLLGVPAVLLFVGLVVGYGWVRNGSASAVLEYTARYDDAVESEDTRVQRVILNALVQLRPLDKEFRYRLARLKLEDGEVAGGAAMMRSLAMGGDRQAALWTAHRHLTTPPITKDTVQRSIDLVLPLTKTHPDDPALHAILGEAYTLIKQPELALPHFKVAVQLDPAYWLRYAKLLQVLKRKGEADQVASRAAAALQNLVAMDPNDIERRIQWADALRSQGLLSECMTVLSRGLELDNENVRLKGELSNTIFDAAVAERSGGVVNYRRFSKLLQQAYRLAPDNVVILSELSEVPSDQHTLDTELLTTAKSVLDGQLKQNPEDAKLPQLLAWCNFQSGQVDDALRDMRRIAEAHPVARLRLAEMLSAADQQTAADSELQTAIRFLQSELETSANPETYLRLSRALSMVDRWEEAIGVLDDTALETEERDPLVDQDSRSAERIRAARIRYRLRFFHKLDADHGNSPKQLALIQEVLAIDPENRLAIAGLGLLAARDNAVAASAQKAMIDLLASGRNSLQIHLQLGTNYLSEENYEPAIRHLSQAARLAPKDPMVANNLAFAICSSDAPPPSSLNRALALADLAITRLPDNPSILRTRGAILARLERFDDALHDFERSLKDDPENPLTHKYLADTYAALGNEELAEAHRAQAEPLAR